MAGAAMLGYSLVAVLSIVLYYLKLPQVVWLVLGIGNNVQPLGDFGNYQCRRLEDERLQACEDMWLSDATRQLFLGCSSVQTRLGWDPSGDHLDASRRSDQGAIIAMDIDVPTPDGHSFAHRALKTSGFAGTAGDGRLHPGGMTGLYSSDTGVVRLLVINARPSLDPVSGLLLDQHLVGANWTIEEFEVEQKAESMKHERTLAHKGIDTPNSIAIAGKSTADLYVTNDHGAHKVGLLRDLSPILSTGNVAHCTAESCSVVASGLKFANGAVAGLHDNRLYVASSFQGGIQIFDIQEDHSLVTGGYIAVPYPIDNLNIDADGTIWAAAFPDVPKLFKAFSDPLNIPAPSAVIKIWRGEDSGYSWEKVLEDRDNEVLSFMTSVVHDARTGRLFLSCPMSSFVVVCEPTAAKK